MVWTKKLNSLQQPRRPRSKGYMPICNLLHLLVWPCIGNRQQYRIRGLLLHCPITHEHKARHESFDHIDLKNWIFAPKLYLKLFLNVDSQDGIILWCTGNTMALSDYALLRHFKIWIFTPKLFLSTTSNQEFSKLSFRFFNKSN